MVKAIFFDFDGTLVNTSPAIVSTMKDTLSALHLPVPDDDTIKQTIGLPLVGALKSLTGFSEDACEEAAAIYRKVFLKYEPTHIGMFPEVHDTVRKLSSEGIRMAICTSRGRDSLSRIISSHGLGDCFETMTTASDNIAPKPAPDMVLTLLARMGLKAEEVLVVGDTTFDILMGNGAGCRTIAVTYGNHSVEKLKSASPTFIIDNFSSILDIVKI